MSALEATGKMTSTSPAPRISPLLTVLVCVTLIALMMIGAAAYLVRHSVQGASNAFRPQITYTTAIAASIGNLKRESKMIVLTVPINVAVHKTNSKTWVGLPLGTTEVLMLVPDNKVQFVVKLDGVSQENFTYDEFAKRVVFKAPMPVLDQDFVDIQSDPASFVIMTNIGWARTDRGSGQKLRSEALGEVRDAVIHEAQKPFLQQQAKAAAELALRRLLTPLLRSLNDDVSLEILFQQPNEGPPEAEAGK